MRRNGFIAAAHAVAWRNVHNWITNPALFVPSLLFPLFFFTAFAGGLSRVDSVPGFDYGPGYTTFVYGFVLLQAATFGGIFTGFSVARDFESGFARRLMLGATSRGGIVAGYWLAALMRACRHHHGDHAGGTARRPRGARERPRRRGPLHARADPERVRGAVRDRGRDAAADHAGGPAIQVPAFLLLFLAPVWVPYDLLTGWVQTAASREPGDAGARVRARLPRR